jgi:hypothetical protein
MPRVRVVYTVSPLVLLAVGRSVSVALFLPPPPLLRALTLPSHMPQGLWMPLARWRLSGALDQAVIPARGGLLAWLLRRIRCSSYQVHSGVAVA